MNDSTDALRARGLSPPRPLLTEALPLVVALCTLLALLLRLYHLGTQSLWVDELLTLDQGRVPGHGLWEQFLDDHQNPLPMVLVTWLSRLSEMEAMLRLPSLLFGAFSVPLLFFVAHHVTRARAAALAAFLLAIHPFHIAHSQEVRGYAAMVFFGLAATLVALNAQGKLRPGRWVVLVLLGTATALSNLQGLFWMAGLALGLVVGGRILRRDLLSWTTAFLAMVVLTYPWWSAVFGVLEFGRLVPGEAVGDPLRGGSTFTPWALPYAGFALAFGRTLGPGAADLHALFSGGLPALAELGRGLMVAAGLSAVLVATLLVVGVRSLGRRRSLELLAWISVVAVAALVLAARNVKPFNPRYVMAALPVLLIVVGSALDRLPRRRALLAVVVWLALTTVSLQHHYFDPAHAHADVRGAARVVMDREGDDDLILVPTVNRVFEHYYRGDSEVKSVYRQDLDDDASVEDLLSRLDPDRRFLWVVEARRWFADPEGRLSRILSERYRRLSEFSLPGVRLELYDREREPLGQD